MIQRRIIVIAALVVTLSPCAFAQKTEKPIRTAIRAARLLDVKTGALINNAVLLVEGERISAVGSGLSVPAGASVIDLGDVTLLPGLIDSHTHLLASSTDDYRSMLLTKSQAYRALEGASMHAAHCSPATLRYAILRAKDLVMLMWPCETLLTAGWSKVRA